MVYRIQFDFKLHKMCMNGFGKTGGIKTSKQTDRLVNIRCVLYTYQKALYIYENCVDFVEN